MVRLEAFLTPPSNQRLPFRLPLTDFRVDLCQAFLEPDRSPLVAPLRRPDLFRLFARRQLLELMDQSKLWTTVAARVD